MKKWLLLTLVCLTSTASAKNPPPKVWTVETARQEALNAPLSIDMASFAPTDPNLAPNKQAIAAQKNTVENRFINTFHFGIYGVTEQCSDKTYYYLPDGRLTAVQYSSRPLFPGSQCPQDKSSLFPIQSKRYWYPTGELVNVIVQVSQTDGYLFKPKGILSMYWVGGHCFQVDHSECNMGDIWGH